MNKFILLLLILIGTLSCKQYVSFETTILKENATKDGIYLDDYVVNLDYETINKFDGEKVVIRGHYTIVEGQDPNDTIVQQSRIGSIKYIDKPKIRKVP
ncbi:MAG: hypothetical protein QNK23_02600 [Crocinitomicaceae bacterium]|nr:hypothetical protein [Crocinitomicaceae bacterium]